MIFTNLALLAAVGAKVALSAATPSAVIDIGTIRGIQATLPSSSTPVNKFLGVPFAESPPQRFSPPTKKGRLSGPLNTQAWKPACLQSFGPIGSGGNSFVQGVFNQPSLPESEDCLYLNVYAPSTTAPAGGRAVMFWIYGGAFQFGNAGQPLYDGSAFAAYQDVIVVTANYRTNVFGFPTSSQLKPSQRNLGLMDQRLALDWVKRNIHAFGGDPKKVTIFGESAGGESVDILLSSYTTATAPFRAAILQSGQFTTKPVDYTNYASTWSTLVSKLGCKLGSSELDCLRRASGTDIKNAVSNSNLVFYPTPDNIVAMTSPRTVRAAGKAANVPVLAGTNAQEGRVFVNGDESESSFLNGFFSRLPKLIAPISAYYNPRFPTNYPRLSQIHTDYGFLCPLTQFAKSCTSAPSAAPVWLYLYNASFPNSAYRDAWGDSAAYHSSEIGSVFQTYAGGPVNPRSAREFGLLQYQLPATARQQALSRTLNRAWASFAKNPAAGPGWPALAPSGLVGVLGNGSAGGAGVAPTPQSRLTPMCGLFAPYYSLYTV